MPWCSDLRYKFQYFAIDNNNAEKIFTVSNMPCAFICISSNNTTVYNYYCCAVPDGYESIVVINKIESSTTNVSLTFTYQNNNNIKVKNSGNYGTLLHILQF
jgi:hypothetical protein